MTPEQQAIGVMWIALTGLAGGALKYLISEIKDCRKECRDDRNASTTAITALTTALNKTLEQRE